MGNDFEWGLIDHKVIYLKAKESILLLAGTDCCQEECYDTIYEFSVQNSKWHKWDVEMPKDVESFGAVVTRNDEYIIIFGGIRSLRWDRKVDDIFVYDTKMDGGCFIKCNIKCPKTGSCEAVITDNNYRDELLVFGFINETYEDFQNNWLN